MLINKGGFLEKETLDINKLIFSKFGERKENDYFPIKLFLKQDYKRQHKGG